MNKSILDLENLNGAFDFGSNKYFAGFGGLYDEYAIFLINYTR